MTVEKFQQIYRLSEENALDDIDRAVQMVCIYLDKTPSQVEQMSLKKFDKLCRKINRLFELKYDTPKKYIRVGRKFYWVNYNAQETAGRYVEGTEYGKDLIGNMHKILASCVQPMTWWGKVKPYKANDHSIYAEDMLKAHFEDVYSISVFFYALFKELMKASHPYLIKEAIMKGMTPETSEKALQDLYSVLDGLQQPNRSQIISGLN